MNVKAFCRRVYRDYAGVDYLEHYASILEQAIAANYTVLDVHAYANAVGQDKLPGRALVLRHDIDTDPRCALAFSAIERNHGVSATYYFRVKTATPDIVRAIAGHGHDIGYHCEDLATVAKQHKAQSAGQMLGLLPEARELALNNLAQLRSLVDAPVVHASSHGDFMNRRLGVTNTRVFDDEFRLRSGIEFEAYDAKLAAPVSFRQSDAIGATAAATALGHAISEPEKCIYFLSHPREWRSGGLSVLKEDAARLFDAISLARYPVRTSG